MGTRKGEQADVGQAVLEAELDRGGIATLLAADSDFEGRAGGAASGDGHFNELADAGLVDGLERVNGDDFLVDIVIEEPADVVAAEAVGHLGQVVGAEGEEIGFLGHFVCEEAGTRDFDHGADEKVELAQAVLGLHFRQDLVDDGALGLEFVDVAGDRDHDLGLDLFAFFEEFGGAFEDGADLHFADLRIGNAEADAAVAHHGVGFVKRFAAFRMSPAEMPRDLASSSCFSMLCGTNSWSGGSRRRKVTGRPSIGREGVLDIAFDEGGELGESSFSFFKRVAEDHLAEEEEGLFASLAVEHMFGAEEADAFGSVHAGDLGVFGGVGVRADTHGAACVDHFHEGLEAGVFGGVDHVEGAEVDIAFGAVEGEHVPLVDDFAVNLDLFVCDVESACADDAAFAPSTGDEGGVAGHSTAGGENTGGRAHTFDVFGVGFFANENNLLPLLGPFNGVGSGEGRRGRKHRRVRRAGPWRELRTFSRRAGSTIG